MAHAIISQLSLVWQYRIYVRLSKDSKMLVALILVVQLTICSGVPQCTNGFSPTTSDKDVLNSFVSNEQNSHTSTHIIPAMTFTCNGTLNSLIFTGEVKSNPDCRYPVFQTWRRVTRDTSTYRVIHPNLSCLGITTNLLRAVVKIYCQFQSSHNNLKFIAGDILGVVLPAANEACLSLLFLSESSSNLNIPTNYVFNTEEITNGTVEIEDSNTTYRGLPQVFLEVEQDCTEGFLTNDFIISQNVSKSTVSIRGRQTESTTRIIPDMTFTCSGTLEMITFAADSCLRLDKTQTECIEPELQVWRNLGTAGTDLHLELVHQNIWCAINSVKMLSTDKAKFSCTLSSTIHVRPGDMLGIVLPAGNQACSQLLFIGEAEIPIPTNYIVTLQQKTTVVLGVDNNNIESFLPLITLHLTATETVVDSEETKQPPTNFTSTLPVTVTTLNTGSEADNLRAIELPIIGLIILMLLGVTIVLLVIFIVKRNKKNVKERQQQQHNTQTTQQALINETYVSADIMMIAMQDASREYESIVSYQNVDTSYPARPGHTNEYDILTESHTNTQASPQQRIVNQEDTMNLSYPHYEQQAHYVPSGEQRLLLSTQCNYTIQTSTTTDTLDGQSFHVFFEETDSFWEPSSNPEELYEQLHAKKYREILTSQLQILNDEQLGIGNFGTVHKGIWQSPMGAMDVAVKTLRSGAKEEEKIKFLQEAAINGQFRHPNVVQLMGVVTVEEPAMIVLELLPNGDLHNYLIKQRPKSTVKEPSLHITSSALLKFCQQIASGMEYLSKKGFVHRDLAARNILVAQDKICKISDFGMCRDLVDDDYYVSHGGQVPIKWTAPEAIYYKKYSTASDVWSFGCILYEIWSLGHKPLETYSNGEAIKMVENGYRLPPPPGCSKELYWIMIQCWHPKTDCRPSFDSLLEMLCKPEYELFMWSGNDKTESRVIGAPLALGQNLYPSLQTVYLQ